MRIRTQIIVTTTFFLFALTAASSQTNLITASSAGKIKLGMTIAQVRKAVAPLKLERTSDGEGVALVGVMKGKDAALVLYAGEEDRDAKIDENAKVEQIWVFDKAYRTGNGVQPSMLLSEAEKKYGKVKSIMMSEIESREYAEFNEHPAGLEFRLLGKDATAGAYPDRSSSATTYTAGAYIFSIVVTGRPTSIADGMSDGEVTYASSYTDLKTGCKSSGGDEGGHVSTFCKGPGNYQIHYFDAATVYQLNVATNDRKWEEALQMIGLDKLDAIGKVEWRTANGEPYAVLIGKPGTDSVIARGLKGFERIKYEESGSGAIERARSMADNAYEDLIVPASPVRFSKGADTASVMGHIKNVRDKLKYVVNATAGDRLTVKIEARKWTGDEGPIMVGVVTSPDGSSDGGPGGTVFDSVVTGSGEYEILVYQNAAKSQTKNIDVVVTISVAAKAKPDVAQFLPSGTTLMHPVQKGSFGGSSGSMVVLYGKEAPAMSYTAMVLTPDSGGYKKLELPLPQFTWSVEEPKAVFFADADGDADMELFIIGECMTGIGPEGAKPFYRTRVYDWDGSGFNHIELLSEEIGRLQTAAAIRGQLPALVKRAQARFQPMDADRMNKKLDDAKTAKTPLQIMSVLLDPFSEMLSRSVAITADSLEPESISIVVTDDGYADDSVRGSQYKFRLTKDVDGNWRVSTALKGWRCRTGRGHQDFSSAPCS